MNLAAKFNIILVLTFSIGFVLISLYSYQLTQINAQQQVTSQAEFILQEALAVRSYTVNEIRPLLNKNEDGLFHPQTVPAYAASTISTLVRKKHPDFLYKEAVFNPTNPANKATLREQKIANQFISKPELKKQVGNFTLNEKKSLFVAYPIKITNPQCLSCHSTPERAPKAMLDIYGREHGFGWQMNQIIGTQMVIVPLQLADKLAQKTFFHFLVSLVLLFLFLFIVLNFILRKLVLQPVSIMNHMADNLSMGNITGNEIEISGKDEISELSRSFNRMRRSVIKIIQILREKKIKVNSKKL